MGYYNIEENNKEYVQPVIEIEYYEDIILCAGFIESPYTNDPFNVVDDPSGTW